MHQQEAIEVGVYRSRGCERAVLERELSGEADGVYKKWKRVRSGSTVEIKQVRPDEEGNNI